MAAIGVSSIRGGLGGGREGGAAERGQEEQRVGFDYYLRYKEQSISVLRTSWEVDRLTTLTFLWVAQLTNQDNSDVNPIALLLGTYSAHCMHHAHTHVGVF